MVSIKQLQNLPIHIRRMIYQYDPTYRIIFDKVLEEMIYYTDAYFNNPTNRGYGLNTIAVKEKYRQGGKFYNPLFNFPYYRIFCYMPSTGKTSFYRLQSCERWVEDEGLYNINRQFFNLRMPTILKYFCIEYDEQHFYDYSDIDSEVSYSDSDNEDE